MTKTVVQCDFDGTITEEDVSFVLLDRFAQGNWRRFLQQYKEHNISVDRFNTQSFALVKADRDTLLQAARNNSKLRPGFHRLATYCSGKGLRLVIISNGLEFYVRELIKDAGWENIEIHVAETRFHPDGLKVQYIGPDGRRLDDGLKETYVKLFAQEGYRVVYVGNGDSDIVPARHAHHVIARDDLLAYWKQNNLKCQPFDDLNDVVTALEAL